MKKVGTLTIIAMLIALATPLPARAAAGDLDASFSHDGKLRTDFFGPHDKAIDIAIQADGKIVVLAGAEAEFALARYNSDGRPDAAFGAAGRTTIDFAGMWDQVRALALQPDGKIVVAGYTITEARSDFALARYNTEGSLDASFGVGGQVSTDFFGHLDWGSDVAVQADGRIVVAGVSDNGDEGVALARYESDGSLDASFGAGGKVTDSFVSDGRSPALGIQPDGRIVVVRTALSNTRSHFAAARYNSDGSPDEGFGAGGKVIDPSFDFEGSGPLPLALQPDGRILVAGTVSGGLFRDWDFGLMRFNEDGSLDESFGNAGRVTTDFFRSFDEVGDVALQADGRIVVAGAARTPNPFIPLTRQDFAIARYNSDGRLDPKFGAGGRVASNLFGSDEGATLFDSDEAAAALAIQPDGRLVVAGSVQDFFIGAGEHFDIAIARYSAGPDFGIALEPQSAQVSHGQKVTVSVIVNRLDGFVGSVTVTPPDTRHLGIKVNKGSDSTDGVVTKFKLKIKDSAPAGSHQLVFTAVDAAGRQRTSTLTLDIR